MPETDMMDAYQKGEKLRPPDEVKKLLSQSEQRKMKVRKEINSFMADLVNRGYSVIILNWISDEDWMWVFWELKAIGYCFTVSEKGVILYPEEQDIDAVLLY